jgi:hypothetical protein
MREWNATTLYITSAHQDLSSRQFAHQPLAGRRAVCGRSRGAAAGARALWLSWLLADGDNNNESTPRPDTHALLLVACSGGGSWPSSDPKKSNSIIVRNYSSSSVKKRENSYSYCPDEMAQTPH